MILIVDDEQSIREIVSVYLERAGYEVLTASDGVEALEILGEQRPALVVLDLMLPEVDGYEITRHLRAHGDVPIIMLTARRQETDRILGLEMGADDYVVKPFSPRELVSRVKAVLRRTEGSVGDRREQTLSFGGLRIDAETRHVEVEGESIELTAKEFDLLWTLAQHPQQVLSRSQLLDLVWGTSEYIDPSTVTVHVHRLREHIEADPTDPRTIQTVWGVGYRFEPEGVSADDDAGFS
jgi:DNA-binding response OmpR family regulator